MLGIGDSSQRHYQDVDNGTRDKFGWQYKTERISMESLWAAKKLSSRSICPSTWINTKSTE